MDKTKIEIGCQLESTVYLAAIDQTTVKLSGESPITLTVPGNLSLPHGNYIVTLQEVEVPAEPAEE